MQCTQTYGVSRGPQGFKNLENIPVSMLAPVYDGHDFTGFDAIQAIGLDRWKTLVRGSAKTQSFGRNASTSGGQDFQDEPHSDPHPPDAGLTAIFTGSDDVRVASGLGARLDS